MTGTLINAAAVLVGTVLGVLIGDRLPERIRETVFHALGLVTLLMGVANGIEAFGPELAQVTRVAPIVVLGSILLGGVLGEALGVERGLNRFGDALKARVGRGQARFTEGFVVATLLFCVGPLAIIGSIQDGLSGNLQILGVKSLLDGFAALAFASALGWGVGFSIIPIVLYQGALSLSAGAVAGIFTEAVVAALTGAGGILIVGIALRLLDLREVRVANLLPAL
ncbi:MAG TPA: DUF554 domain-containing protein, partial [Actinomycetota bacterium]|nr:DUF554 domain-containing protein [Actinomycetota bacterium]